MRSGVIDDVLMVLILFLSPARVISHQSLVLLMVSVSLCQGPVTVSSLHPGHRGHGWQLARAVNQLSARWLSWLGLTLHQQSASVSRRVNTSLHWHFYHPFFKGSIKRGWYSFNFSFSNPISIACWQSTGAALGISLLHIWQLEPWLKIVEHRWLSIMVSVQNIHNLRPTHLTHVTKQGT